MEAGPAEGSHHAGWGLDFDHAIREAEAAGFVVEPRKTFAILRVPETKHARALAEFVLKHKDAREVPTMR